MHGVGGNLNLPFQWAIALKDICDCRNCKTRSSPHLVASTQLCSFHTYIGFDTPQLTGLVMYAADRQAFI